MENKTKIFVTIDGIKHEMNIPVSDEPLARKAAKLVDERLISLKSKWRVGVNLDYMTMVAFQLAYEKIVKETEEQKSDINNKLSEISDLLEK